MFAAFTAALAVASNAHADAPVPPPRGLVDYCAQAPSACGVTADTEDQTQAQQDDEGARRRAWFRTLLRERTSDGAAQHVVWTEARAAELDAVNRDINAAIFETTDEDIYGATEVWATPLSAPAPEIGGTPRGDCEDFVLEKRLRLIALGWPPESLSIALAHAQFRGLHVVLIARTDRGEFVLDNTQSQVLPRADLPYEWLSHQAGADMLRWASFSPSASGRNADASE